MQIKIRLLVELAPSEQRREIDNIYEFKGIVHNCFSTSPIIIAPLNCHVAQNCKAALIS